MPGQSWCLHSGFKMSSCHHCIHIRLRVQSQKLLIYPKVDLPIWFGVLLHHSKNSFIYLSRHLTKKEMLYTGTVGVHLLVLGWTPFRLQNNLNYSCHRFNKWLETLLRESHTCSRFVGSTSQRCSIGLRSGDHARHFITVKLSCSSNQFEMTWALWHATLATRGWTLWS